MQLRHSAPELSELASTNGGGNEIGAALAAAAPVDAASSFTVVAAPPAHGGAAHPQRSPRMRRHNNGHSGNTSPPGSPLRQELVVSPRTAMVVLVRLPLPAIGRGELHTDTPFLSKPTSPSMTRCRSFDPEVFLMSTAGTSSDSLFGQ